MIRHRSLRPALQRAGVLSTLATTLMVLTACDPTPGRHSATVATTTLRIWYGTDDPTERTWVQGLARHEAARHPSVRVKLTTYDLDDLNDKMRLALNAGTPPDLVYTTPRGPGLPAYV